MGQLWNDLWEYRAEEMLKLPSNLYSNLYKILNEYNVAYDRLLKKESFDKKTLLMGLELINEDLLRNVLDAVCKLL